MTELFLKIVNMSISATWLVLAVLALRLILKKAPKWVNVLLWGIVAVRLICPFSIESALSLIPSTETISPEIMMDWTPEISTGIEPLDRVVNPAITSSFAPEPSASANPLQILIPVSANLWLLGIIVMLVYTVVSYWRLRRRVSTAVILQGNIFQSENVSSPFVLGIIKPRIYLPYTMDDRNLEHVVAHEQAHIRRKDHWWKPLGFLLLTIHWFNPLMWFAYILLCRDIELACDEKVIKELGNEQRADYTQALVACSVNRRMIAACPLAFGEVGVKERVKSIMNYRKPTFWIIVTAMVVCVIVSVCFLTDPLADDSALQYWITSYLRDTEQTEVQRAYNRDSKSLPVTVKFESSQGPSEIELIYGFKKNGEGDWWYSDPLDLHVGESIEFTVPADNHFLVTAMPIGGENGNVSFRFTEGLYTSGDSRKVIEWFDYTEDPSQMSYEGELKIQLDEFPDITFKYTPHDIIATTSWEDSNTAGKTFLISGMPIWNAYFCDLTGDGLPEICSQVSRGSGIIDNHVIIYDYANGVSYKLEDRGNYDYYLRMNDADGYLYVDKRVYNSDEFVSSGRLVFKDGCIQVEGVQTAPTCILRAKLLEIHDGYYLVEPVEGSWELSSANKIEVPIMNMNPALEPQVGDIIEITYDGEILETYPARLSKVYSIKVTEETSKLSLNDVIILSQYGYDLSWSDFENYDYIETGSGLYIRVYEINELFELWIGGAGPYGDTSYPDSDPMYIYLKSNDGTDAKIDIRDGGVTEFISEHKSNSAETSDLIPMVMVNEILYLDTGYESSAIERTDHFDGEIISQVEGNQKPSVDDQSNFGTGYGYQYGATEGTIEIYMNGKQSSSVVPPTN